ncbi:MAG TPA: hypothetical protein VGB37_02465 [Candidatus Lokiarchaeia archaeon]
MNSQLYLIPQKGDILLVSSRIDPLAKIIQIGTCSKWNHVAWIYSETFIVEINRKGIYLCPIKKYYNRFLFDIKIVRPKNLSRVEVEVAECLLLKHECKTLYSKLLIAFILVAFQFKKQLPRPTCSGLIAEILAHLGFKFKNKLNHLITPKDINDSKNVDVVYE